jgi:hypothetical protein
VKGYSDAIEMLKTERPDIVAVCTNVKGRSEDHGLTVASFVPDPAYFYGESLHVQDNMCDS